ncbi:MAG: GNAT family N-acetyltransferase [Gemmatimonadetes bacterium]|nr:MAG: GNAT family N-acetyltransferase [Gemmatimonadota bacterium]PYP05873.1 MAG: GNAT family N-acetyltransferase [Gemmatimonadota bacterium]PYP76315.1 MAG: GNAT family N-acetyltransferase [Gemmatimonadota bacterium]
MSALPIFGEQGAGSREQYAPARAESPALNGGYGSLLPAPCSLPGVVLRGAVLSDVPQLEVLMAPYVATGDLLPRSNYDLCRHIKEYVVAEGPAGEVIGCGSLKVYSRDLAELAALAVRADWQRAGVGGALLAALIAEARVQGLAEVLALTRKPGFFLKVGFAPAEREHFPLKVWADCARCPRQNCCDEVAVVLRL